MLANSCTSHHYFESSGKSITMTVPYRYCIVVLI
jgi:hypothetical protein